MTKELEILPSETSDKKTRRQRFKDLEQEAMYTAKIVDGAYTVMARTLTEINDIFKEGEKAKDDLGYETFEDWVEAKLGWSRRKAKYLISIWENLHDKAGLTEAQIKEIEWTKAKELAPLAKSGELTKENADKWIGKTKDNTTEELKAAVKKKMTGTEPEVVTRVKFGLYEDQYRNWELALEKAAKLTESDKVPHQVDMIALEFNSAHADHDVPHTALVRLCQRVVEVFGVKLIAIRGEEVVFGKKFVKELLES